MRRLVFSILGTVTASIVATLALRRLLLATDQGTGKEPGNNGVVVIMPIVIGNKLVLGARPRWWRRHRHHQQQEEQATTTTAPAQ